MSRPKRLIEVDLPIREISVHARREKSIRHGHISTLHIWWARRPLAACRAVVLAALIPDPGDPECPEAFRTSAAEALGEFRNRAGGPPVDRSPEGLRRAILEFIGRFAAWEASTDPAFLDCARALVVAAHREGSPLVVDPFAGGGAIPLETLRVGADAWASDYNPVAALLLKVVLEYVPRYGERLANAIREWGQRVRERVEADLGRFHPPDPDGAIPIAYLWARTVTCEGPGCGAEIPLLRQLWLARKVGRQVGLRLVIDRELKRIEFEVEEGVSRVSDGTARRGSAVCPVCNIVTPATRVRAQGTENSGLPARMVAVVRTYPNQQGRHYRIATERDERVAADAADELRRREKEHQGRLSLVPNEPFPTHDTRAFTPGLYGVATWGDLSSPRQALALSSFTGAVATAGREILAADEDQGFARAVATCLALPLGRSVDYWATLCRWVVGTATRGGEFIAAANGGESNFPPVRDFAEANPFSGATGSWDGATEWVSAAIESIAVSELASGQSAMGDARDLPLPDITAQAVFTDPPYYAKFPYADLSDFFYVWLRRAVGDLHPELFASDLSPKRDEIVVNTASARAPDGRGVKNDQTFEQGMREALAEIRRITTPDGLLCLVFAEQRTKPWEVMLQALVHSRWVVTGSWPLNTERPGRRRELGSSALASSIHIVCRPRPQGAGNGDWRAVRAELERRVAEWLPRLSAEGIEGADAIFACLGPAMEVYSRFERVETAAGDPVPLSPPEDEPDAPAFLPAVWAAVAREALRMIFEGGEAEGFEEDARLTALWLWTLRAAVGGDAPTSSDGEGANGQALRGFALDYDTARKLSQALGAHPEELGRPGGILEVRGASARLLSVGERRQALLGTNTLRGGGEVTLFEPAEETADGAVTAGRTTLDRLHQTMLLFSDGRAAALRRLLAEVGDERFRRLARALSALYPPASAEKRWVDGVLGALRQAGG